MAPAREFSPRGRPVRGPADAKYGYAGAQELVRVTGRLLPDVQGRHRVVPQHALGEQQLEGELGGCRYLEWRVRGRASTVEAGGGIGDDCCWLR